MTSTRPILDLGPLTGSKEYIHKISQEVVDTFNGLMGMNLELVEGPGCTDTVNFVSAPLSEYDAYLVVEHELSHPFFGSNIVMGQAFAEKQAEKYLLRAGIPYTHPSAESYKKYLQTLAFQTLNLLDDHRVCSMWTELFYGGGTFLRQRWTDITVHDIKNTMAEKDILCFFMKHIAGVPVPGAPPEFHACIPHIDEALDLVKRSDFPSCVAVAARLVDKIADELYDPPPPPQPPQPSSGGQQGKPQKGQGKGGSKPQDPPKSGKGPQNSPPPPGQQKPTPPKNAKQKAKDKLDAITKALLPPGMAKLAHGHNSNNAMGANDVVQSRKGQRGKRDSAASRVNINKLLKASKGDPTDPNGEFQKLLKAGTAKMEAKIEAAKQHLSGSEPSERQKSDMHFASACKIAGIQRIEVTPTRELPRETPAAYHLRQHLEKVKMKNRRKITNRGSGIDIGSLLQAQMGNNLVGMNFFVQERREPGFELLMLLDMSGSMSGYGVQLITQGLADTEFACKTLGVKVTQWCYSDKLYTFNRLGDPASAGVQMRMTHTVQALEVAKLWAQEDASTRAIVLATDGIPTTVRAHHSTGNPIKDLHNVLAEIRSARIVMSILGIGNDRSTDMFDSAFGKGNYGRVSNASEMATALPEMARVLVESHIKRHTR